VTGLYAARVAARVRRELKADVDMVHGRYGEFKILVDGETLIDGGNAAFLGVLPSGAKIMAALKAQLSK
jgi:hypothetical protein